MNRLSAAINGPIFIAFGVAVTRLLERSVVRDMMKVLTHVRIPANEDGDGEEEGQG